MERLSLRVAGADLEAVFGAFCAGDSALLPEYHQARGDSKLVTPEWQCVGPEGQAAVLAQAWSGQREVTWESVVYAPPRRPPLKGNLTFCGLEWPWTSQGHMQQAVCRA